MATFLWHFALWGMHILKLNQLDPTMNHPKRWPIEIGKFLQLIKWTKTKKCRAVIELIGYWTFVPSHFSRISNNSLLAASWTNEMFTRNPYKCGNIFKPSNFFSPSNWNSNLYHTKTSLPPLFSLFSHRMCCVHWKWHFSVCFWFFVSFSIVCLSCQSDKMTNA